MLASQQYEKLKLLKIKKMYLIIFPRPYYLAWAELTVFVLFDTNVDPTTTYINIVH